MVFDRKLSLKRGRDAGFDETDSHARDVGLYETILSGDLNADDVDVTGLWDLMDESTRAENSFAESLKSPVKAIAGS